jgi:NADH-quinone oxidoreductase subunit E
VDDLQAGNPVSPTRGPSRLCTFREMSRVLAGFEDGLATEGPSAGAASLVGLKIAQERGWTAPSPDRDETGNGGTSSADAGSAAGTTGESHPATGSTAASGPPGAGVSHAESANPRPGPGLGKSSGSGKPSGSGKEPQ